MGLPYVVGVQSTLSVWPPGTEPLPPKPWSGRGRPPSRVRRDGEHAPVSAKTLAMGLSDEAWRVVRVARRLQRNLVLALCRGADTTRFARLETGGATSARMAPHRMARGRKRADEILAFDLARRHAHRRSRRHGQIALAHRARLRGIEKRTRPRPFRGAKLARLPSPCIALHCSLRLPDPRTSGDSPLRLPATPNTSPIPASQTPRRRRSDPSGTSKTRSPPSAESSQSFWREPSHAARAAKPCDKPTLPGIVVTQ